MLMFIAIIGSCGGSTAGGLKMIRTILFKEKSILEAKRVIHPQDPQGVFTIKLGNIGSNFKNLPKEALWISDNFVVYIRIFTFTF